MGTNRNPKNADALFPMQVSALDFKVGDCVKKITSNHMNDTVGVVSHLLPKTFQIRVQWPYGNDVEAPEQIYKVDPQTFPPTVKYDSSYSSHETAASEKEYGSLPKKKRASSKIAESVALRYLEKVADLESLARIFKAANMTNIQAYLKLSADYSKSEGDVVVRLAVNNVYGK